MHWKIKNKKSTPFRHLMRQSLAIERQRQPIFFLFFFQFIEISFRWCKFAAHDVKSSRFKVSICCRYVRMCRAVPCLCAHCDTVRLKSIILLMVIVTVAAVSVTNAPMMRGQPQSLTQLTQYIYVPQHYIHLYFMFDLVWCWLQLCPTRCT